MPVEVRVPAQPTWSLRRMVHVPAPLWAVRITHLLEHTQIPELRAIVQVCVPLGGATKGTALPTSATADSLLQAGWRPDLVLQMPRELHQPELAELPVSLRHPLDITSPSASPLLGDDNPSGSIKHYFLTGLSVASQEQLLYLVSAGRFAFCSAPLPDLQAMARMPTATTYQELQTCLQRTLVAVPGPGPAAAAAPSA